jgi:transposase
VRLRCPDCGPTRRRCAGAGALARSAAERSLSAALATFIAALSVRYHVSRAKIREFLAVWFGVPLSVGTLDRCIREVGVACEPVVEDLLGDLRQAGVIHADETPWKQHGRLRWLWVVLSSTTAIFHIGSRQGDEIRDLIGDAFLG